MAQRVCQICQRPFDPERSRALPFCSERCRQIDLGRWLREEYGLPWEPEQERAEGWEADREGDPHDSDNGRR